jgi:hypothetical protein
LDNANQSSNSMKKTLFPIVPISLFIVGMILACNLPTVTVQWSGTETPTLTLTTTLTNTSTPAPTATSTLTPVPPTKTFFPTATRVSTLMRATATPNFAPFCEAEASIQSQCQYPIANQSSTFCIKKSPYTLIALNDRATYKLLNDYVQCEEAGVIDGQRMITCTGPMAYYFELQVCDSACSSLTIETGSTKCPLGYNYNNLRNCCTQETQEVSQGCTVLKLRTQSCTIDCDQFTSRSTCEDYGYACRWNNTNYSCQLRK